MRVLAATDIIALVCILLFTIWGYLKGFFPALFGILGVVVGYATMIVFSRPLGDAVAGLGVLPPELPKFVIYMAASMGLFFGVQIAARLAAACLDKKATDGLGAAAGSLYKGSGAAVGAMTGALISMMLIWGVLLYRAVLREKNPDRSKARQLSVSERLTGKALGSLADRIIRAKGAQDDPIAAAIKAVAVDPDAGVKGARKMIEDRIQSAAKDPKTLAAMLGGDAEQLPEGADLVDNPEVRKLLKRRQ